MTDAAARAVAHAALSGPFEPKRFLYGRLTAEDRAAALSALAEVCDEVVVDGALRWEMRPGPRAQHLKRLAGDSAARRRLWRQRPPLKADWFARTLQTCLTGAPVDADEADSAALRAAISAAGYAAAAVDDPAQRDALAGIQSTLRRRAVAVAQSAREKTVLPVGLKGRTAERAALNAFFASGAITPPVQGRAADAQSRLRSLLVTGSPGMGKSAFLAAIAGDQGRDPADPWIVSLDFDRHTLAHGGIIAWTEDLTRQIGTVTPDLAAPLSRIRAIHAQDRRETLGLSGPEAAARLIQDILEAMAAVPAPRPLIVLVDTIEELVAQNTADAFATAPDGTQLAQLLAWLGPAGFGSGAPGPIAEIRLIAAGRAPTPAVEDRVSAWFNATLALPELDDAAAVDLLTAQDSRMSPKVCQRLVDSIGGHPLHLKLAQKHLASLPARARPGELATLEKRGLRGANPDLILRTLYSRFLIRLRVRNLPEGLTIEDVRALTHPGLVLRQIDVPLLREVIAPATDVDLSAPGLAERAFAVLQDQLWLVVPGERAGTIRHRPDVRRVMLDFMLNVDSGDANTVLDEAVAWHERQDSWDGRVEAGYLRALRGETGTLLENPDLALAVRTVAGADLDLMPPISRAVLKIHDPEEPILDDRELAALGGDRALVAALRRDAATVEAGGRRAARPRPAAAPSGPEAVLDLLPKDGDAFAILDHPDLTRAVDIAFLEADFEAVAALGWGALGRIADWPDPNRPFGQKTFHESWLWRLTLASAIVAPPADWADRLPAEPTEDWTAYIGSARNAPITDALASRFDLDALRAMCIGPDIVWQRLKKPAIFKPRGILVDSFRALRLLGASPFLLRAVQRSGASLTYPLITAAIPYLAFLWLDDGDIWWTAFAEDRRRREIRRDETTDMILDLIWTTRQGVPRPGTPTADIFGRLIERLDTLSLRCSAGGTFTFDADGPLAPDAMTLHLRGQTPELHGVLARALVRKSNSPISPILESSFWSMVAEVQDDTDGLVPSEGTLQALQTLMIPPWINRGGSLTSQQVTLRVVRLLDLLGILPITIRALAAHDGRPELQRCADLLTALDRRWPPQIAA